MFKLRLPKTPRRRAYEAQVELARVLLKPGMDREQAATALSSVITTAELAGTGGWNERFSSSRFLRFEQVSTKYAGHKTFREKHPEKWAELEGAVWTLLGSGRGRVELVDEVFRLLAPHCFVRLIPPRKLVRLADAA